MAKMSYIGSKKTRNYQHTHYWKLHTNNIIPHTSTFLLQLHIHVHSAMLELRNTFSTKHPKQIKQSMLLG
jgi:hypothetical protein